MLKLRKIYIENFKGIEAPKIVDLDDSSFSILSGPNGFGKTTIFDAVELCLRGKLQRTDSFSRVTKDNADYLKPFYQHTKGSDVVLKLLLQDDCDGSFHIIAKFLDKDHEGRLGATRRFKPNAWNILTTYHSIVEEISDFEKKFDSNDFNEVDQTFIDGLFFQGTQLSHVNLYPLFNYLQQEENIYFLKKDEEEKKSELDFLFQTQRQSQELDTISTNHKKIKELTEELKQRIERLGAIASETSQAAYQALFPDASIAYDQEDLFEGKATDSILENFNVYLRDIDTLAEFIKTFSVQEYKKEKVVAGINAVLNSRPLLTAFVLFPLLENEKYNALMALNSKIEVARRLLSNIEADIVGEKELIEFGFSEQFVFGYKEAIAQKVRIITSMSELDRIIVDLNDAREKVINHSVGLPNEVHQPENCPLCDTNWSTSEDLSKAVVLKTDALIRHNSQNQEILQAANSTIERDYKIPVKDAATKFLEMPENNLDNAFVNSLAQLKGHRDAITRFIALLSTVDISLGDQMLIVPVSNSLLQERVSNLEAGLKLKMTEILPEQNKLINKHLFKELFGEDVSKLITIDEVNAKREYIKAKYDQARHFSLQILAARLEQFQTLERKINKIKEEYSRAIKDFKRDMIERIKIPFYLYSGKILQNYQQGYGIFVEMPTTTARVRFLTDNTSDHDIVHHLSSGQLAVVSIAFCLSLNKVYQTSQHFKFLAIDDPIQTLDDINVHALIELMRHEFSDYQILLSTHETDIEKYLNYKFSNFGFKCNRINVQKEFFGVQSSL